MLTVINSSGCSATDTLWVAACIDIDDKARSKSIRIYPNPTDGYFTLSTTYSKEGTFKMYSTSGQLIEQTQVMPGKATTIPTQHLAAGIYLIEIQSETSVWHHKISVVH